MCSNMTRQTRFQEDYRLNLAKSSLPVLQREGVCVWGGGGYITVFDFCLFDLILYVTSTIFQLYRDESSWVEPVLS